MTAPTRHRTKPNNEDIRLLQLLTVERMTPAEAANHIGVHLSSVEQRLWRIRRKLDARNTLDAVVLAVRGGYLDLRPQAHCGATAGPCVPGSGHDDDRHENPDGWVQPDSDVANRLRADATS
ncbi:helix-turn-helix transcriptional regulator [Melissospora conviva]|uniref:helix-turn-helix transcriptional regulator n=1 Tax=Melissospora conviva TaxID=3388432 RepID=UPI003C20A7A6